MALLSPGGRGGGGVNGFLSHGERGGLSSPEGGGGGGGGGLLVNVGCFYGDVVSMDILCVCCVRIVFFFFRHAYCCRVPGRFVRGASVLVFFKVFFFLCDGQPYLFVARETRERCIFGRRHQ